MWEHALHGCRPDASSDAGGARGAGEGRVWEGSAGGTCMTKARIGLTAPTRASAALAKSAPLVWYRTVMRSERHSCPRHPGPVGPNASGVPVPGTFDWGQRPHSRLTGTTQPASDAGRPPGRPAPPRFDLSLSGPAPSLSGPTIIPPIPGPVKASFRSVAQEDSASPLRRNGIANFGLAGRVCRRAHRPPEPLSDIGPQGLSSPPLLLSGRFGIRRALHRKRGIGPPPDFRYPGPEKPRCVGGREERAGETGRFPPRMRRALPARTSSRWKRSSVVSTAIRPPSKPTSASAKAAGPD